MGTRASIAAATVLALALRLYGIGSDSFWPDEGCTWTFTQRPWSEVPRWAAKSNCPAYYLLAKVVADLFGDSETALRLPSALLLAAFVPLVARLATRMGGGPVGAVVAAFVAALAPAMIHYGQEARTYALFVVASAATLLALSRTIDLGTGDVAPRARDVIALGVWGALLLYSHPYGALEMTGIGLYVAARWIRDRRLPDRAFLGLALAGVLGAQRVLALLHRADRVGLGFWIQETSPVDFARVPGKLLHLSHGDAGLFLLGALILWSCVRLPRAWRWLAVAVAVACWIGPAIHGHVAHAAFVDRYALGLAPFAVAAIGCLVAHAARRSRRMGQLVGAAILVAMAADAAYYHATRPHRPDWKGAFAAQKRLAAEGATPVVLGGTEDLAAYYLRIPAVIVRLSRGPNKRLEALPRGHIAIVAPPRYRDALLSAVAGREIVRERPRTSGGEPVLLEVR